MPTLDELIREESAPKENDFGASAFPSLETASELKERTSFGGFAESEPPLLIESARQVDSVERTLFSDPSFRQLQPDSQTKVLNAEYLHNNFNIPRTDALNDQEAIIKGIYGEEATPDKARRYLRDNWVSGRITTTIGLYASMLLLNEGDPDEVKRQIQYWQRQMPSADRVKHSLPKRMVAEFLNQIPMYLEGVRRGLPVALGSALTWGAVGLTMGGVPAAITAPAGFAVGMQTKVVETVMRLEGGLAYLELQDLGIEPEIARPAALAVGVINGVLEMAGIQAFLKSVGGKNFAKIGMKSVLMGLKENPKIHQILFRHAAEFTGQLTTEVAQEVAQEVTNVIMDEFSVYVHNRVKSEKLLHKWDKALPRLKEIALKSTLGFIPMLLPGHIVRGGGESLSAMIDKTIKEIPETKITEEKPIEQGPKIQVVEPKTREVRTKVLPKKVPENKARINEAELSEGDKVKIDGKEHQVLAITKNGTIIENTETREKYVVPSYGEIDIDKTEPETAVREITRKEIHDYAKLLRDQAIEDYKSSRETDFITRLKDRVGKINVRFFKQAEELKDIPPKVKRAIFTKDVNAMDLDEAAMAMGMSDTDLIQALKSPDLLQAKPSQTIRDYYNEAEYELVSFYEMKGEHPVVKREDVTALEKTPYGQLKKLATSDEEFLKYAATYMRKFYNLGKREKARAVKEKAALVMRRKRAIAEINARRKKAIGQIEKVRKHTAKLPDPQRGQIEELIGDIDFVRHPAKKIAQAERARAYFKEHPELEIPERVMNDLEMIEKKKGSELTLNEVESLRDTVTALYTQARRKLEIKDGRAKKLFVKTRNEAISEMKPPDDVKENIINLNPGRLRGAKDLGKLIKNIMGIRSNHYDLIVETISGLNSVVDRIFNKAIERGTNTQRRLTKHLYNVFQGELKRVGFKYKPHEIDGWLRKKFHYEFDGVKIDVSRNQKINLYMHWLNSDNRAAITEGGFGSRAIDNHDKVFVFSRDPEKAAEIYKKIIDNMTKEEIQFAEAAIPLAEETYQIKDKVYYIKHGFHLPKAEGVYWHKSVMPIEIGRDYAAEEQLRAFKSGQHNHVGLPHGDLIARTGSRAAIYLNDFTYDLNALIHHAAAYGGLELPLSEAGKMLYDQEFKSVMMKRYGPDVYYEIENGLKDVAGQWKDFTSVEKMIMKMKDKMTVAALTHPRVWLMQTLSYALIYTYVKPKYLAQAAVQSIFRPKELDTRHKIFSPKYEERASGYMSRDVADIFKRMSQRQIYGGKKTAKEVMMGPLRFFDLRTVRAGMQAVVLQSLDAFKSGYLTRDMKLALNLTDEDIVNLSAEDKVRFSYEMAEWVMDRTQPMFNPTHRSSLSRGKPIEQIFTLYSSFTNQELNLLRRTFHEMKRYKDADARAHFVRAAFSILVVNTLGATAIRGIYDRIMKKKKRKPYVRILESWASMFYFLRGLVPAIISVVERGPLFSYDMTIPHARLANYIKNVLGGAIIAAEGKMTKKQLERWILDVWGVASYGFGLPFTIVPDVVNYVTREDKKKGSVEIEKKKY